MLVRWRVLRDGHKQLSPLTVPPGVRQLAVPRVTHRHARYLPLSTQACRQPARPALARKVSCPWSASRSSVGQHVAVQNRVVSARIRTMRMFSEVTVPTTVSAEEATASSTTLSLREQLLRRGREQAAANEEWSTDRWDEPDFESPPQRHSKHSHRISMPKGRVRGTDLFMSVTGRPDANEMIEQIKLMGYRQEYEQAELRFLTWFKDAKSTFNVQIRQDHDALLVLFNELLRNRSIARDPKGVEMWFQSLLQAGLTPDYTAYNSIIRVHATMGEVDEVRRWVDVMVANGMEPNAHTKKNIIIAMSKINHMEEAAAFLTQEWERIGEPPHYSLWEVLLDGFTRNRRFAEAVQWLKRMLEIESLTSLWYFHDKLFMSVLNRIANDHHEIRPVGLLLEMLELVRQGSVRPLDRLLPYELILQTLLSLRTAKGVAQAEQVFMWLREDGVEADMHIMNLFIDHFSEQGRLSDMYQWLDLALTMKITPDVDTLTLMVRGYLVKGDRQGAADEYFRLTRDYQLTPSMETFSQFFKYIGGVGDMEGMLPWFSEMERHGVRPTLEQFNLVLEGVCSHSRLDEAKACFEALVSAGLEPDTLSYNAVIKAHCKRADLEGGQKWVQRMLSDGVKPDEHTFSPIIEGYCQINAPDSAISWMRLMDTSGVASRHTYEIVIRHYCKAGKISSAKFWYHEMRRKRIPMSPSILGVVAFHAARIGEMHKAITIFEDFKSKGYVGDTELYNMLLKGAVDQKQHDHALQWFQEMKNFNVERDVETYHHILRVHFANGDVELVMKTLNEMTSEGLKTSVATNSLLLQGLCDQPDVRLQEVERLFSLMEQHDTSTHRLFVSCCMKAGEVFKAVQHVRQMPQEYANVSLFSAVLEGLLSRLSGDDAAPQDEVDAHGAALEDMFRMVSELPAQSQIDSSVYVLLMRVALCLSRHDLVDQSYSEALRRNVVPDTSMAALMTTSLAERRDFDLLLRWLFLLPLSLRPTNSRKARDAVHELSACRSFVELCQKSPELQHAQCVVVKGLPHTVLATKDHYRDHFSQFGVVKHVELVLGGALVVFDSTEVAAKVTGAKSHLLSAFPTFALTVAPLSRRGVLHDPASTYIDGIPYGTAEDALRRHFAQFGEVRAIEVFHPSRTVRGGKAAPANIGFARVEFASADSASTCRAKPKQRLSAGGGGGADAMVLTVDQRPPNASISQALLVRVPSAPLASTNRKTAPSQARRNTNSFNRSK